MPLFKSDARRFSFDLTDLQLDVTTASFAKTQPGPMLYSNVHITASRAETQSDDEFASTEAARLSVSGNTRDVVGVLIRALAEIAAADPLDVCGMALSSLAQTEFRDYLLFIAHPGNGSMNVLGRCANCNTPAAGHVLGDVLSSWIHIGPSCGPGEGTFVPTPDAMETDPN